ncbi:hypothetical protein ACPOL_2866 [Acidisarcina polymorpha]|uniref:Uncharacterized protein n=1 Tax=Acidisarcina polymorpha TaxID=2211140 RepID=A0A2Z5FZM2_9BACT|nr:hypothetical protein ACPOL_2866 [Acidisarcina polymorpha]
MFGAERVGRNIRDVVQRITPLRHNLKVALSSLLPSGYALGATRSLEECKVR